MNNITYPIRVLVVFFTSFIFLLSFFALFPVSAQDDTVAPSIVSVSANGTVLTVSVSEPVYAPNGVGEYDFMMSNCFGEPLEDGVVSGLAATAAGATSSFTVQFSKVACVNDRLIYNGDGIRDVAGNVMGMQGNQHDNNLVTGGATPPADLGDGGTNGDDGNGNNNSGNNDDGTHGNNGNDDDTIPPHLLGITGFGDLAITGTQAQFTFSYLCEGDSCSDNFNASYVFHSTSVCDASIGGNVDVGLTDVGTDTKQSQQIDISVRDGNYMCVKVSDHNVSSNYFHSYSLPVQTQQIVSEPVSGNNGNSNNGGNGNDGNNNGGGNDDDGGGNDDDVVQPPQENQILPVGGAAAAGAVSGKGASGASSSNSNNNGGTANTSNNSNNGNNNGNTSNDDGNSNGNDGSNGGNNDDGNGNNNDDGDNGGNDDDVVQPPQENQILPVGGAAAGAVSGTGTAGASSNAASNGAGNNNGAKSNNSNGNNSGNNNSNSNDGDDGNNGNDDDAVQPPQGNSPNSLLEVVLPDTEAERIALAETTTNLYVFMALLPLYPEVAKKNPLYSTFMVALTQSCTLSSK